MMPPARRFCGIINRYLSNHRGPCPELFPGNDGLTRKIHDEVACRASDALFAKVMNNAGEYVGRAAEAGARQ